MALGEYPLVGRGQARELHFAARKTLIGGIDPMAERKSEAEAKHRAVEARQRESESSFENVAANGGTGGRLASLRLMRIPLCVVWKQMLSRHMATNSSMR